MKYIIEICAAIDIAILGIAYPILIDKTSNIGERYKSEYLSNVFDLEIPQWRGFRKTPLFKFLLFLTIASLVFKVLSLEPLPYFENNYFVSNSADILVFSLTLFLTFVFFLWLDKLMLYHGKTSKLLKYLIEKYSSRKKEDQNKTYLLKSINEMTIYAIENQDHHLQAYLLDFYWSLFNKVRKDSEGNEGVEYPIDMYFLVSDVIAAALQNSRSKLITLETTAASGDWFLGGGFTYLKIHKSTYTWLWRNIQLLVDSKLLLSTYWSSVSQFYNYRLSRIASEYDGYEVINKDSIKEREDEREEFQELHYALGGLLIYVENYQSLKYILTFSQSSPPVYPLLPGTMDEIFYWFNHFSNVYKTLKEPIDRKYPFPGLDNLGVSNRVNHNICLYIAVLFIRQFSLIPHYTYHNFKEFINLPAELSELYQLNERLDYFKNCIDKVLNNDQLMETLGYKTAAAEMMDTFEKLATQIKDKISEIKLNTNLSAEKIAKFKASTAAILEKGFTVFDEINNKNDLEAEDTKFTTAINGQIFLSSKSSFVDGDIPNFNYDSVYAQGIVSDKLNYYIPNAFLFARTARYLLNEKDYIKGIAKIIGNKPDVTILCFSPSYQTRDLLDKSTFKDRIIYLPAYYTHLRDSVFILDKKDLPKIQYNDIPEADKTEFSPEKIDEKRNIYAAVIDINTIDNIQLKEKFIQTDTTELQVIVLIAFVCVIKWNKERNIIQINLNTPYKERGILNDLVDIKSLE